MTDKLFKFKCACGAPSHTTDILIDKEHKEVLIYASLNHYLPWYKRLLPAIRYVLGIDNTFVMYNESYLTLDDFNLKITEIKEYLEEMDNE